MIKKFLRVSVIIITVAVVAFVSLAVAAALTQKNFVDPEWIIYDYTNVPLPNDGIFVLAQEAELNGTELETDFDSRDFAFVLSEDSSAEFTIEIPKNGLYRLEIGYKPLPGSTNDLEFGLLVDGLNPGSERSVFSIYRVWRGSDSIVRSSSGNDLRPAQIEANIWLQQPIADSGIHNENLILELSAGTHNVMIYNALESFAVSHVTLINDELLTYEQYRQIHSAVSNVPDDYYLTIQAENIYLKSHSSTYPSFDRTSPLTQPYHPVNMRLNTLGGINWYENGQWVKWKFKVSNDGWYQIGLRCKQNSAKGFFSARKIIIDGQLPYEELSDIKFTYSERWKGVILGSQEPYMVWLSAGEHELSIAVTLGSLEPLVSSMQNALEQLNQLYRDIIMITGTTPDVYRDYDLFDNIPGLHNSMLALDEQLTGCRVELQDIAHEGELSLAILEELITQLDDFKQSDYTIPRRLSRFLANITAFADWIFEISMQPLEIDYIILSAPGAIAPESEAGVWQQIVHETSGFIGSFLQDYDNMEGTADADHSGSSITVWLGLGRDQAFALRRLIDESFTPQYGISIDLSVTQNALLRATVAGKGPDVNLFTRRGEIMNLAFRGALAPLNEMEGFDKLTCNYMDTAFIPYEYQNNIYAIPNNQSFLMMFTRDDILNDMSIKKPTTWNELMDIAPVLQSRSMGIGLPYQNLDAYALLNNGVGTLTIFPTLLMQNGGSLYTEARDRTRLDEPIAQDVFKMWTDFYTMYSYTLYKDDFNRFRTGEMPIIIAEYGGMYNRLMGAAPELKGSWSMHPIPGTPDDGGINITSASNGSGDIILQSCSDPDAAWTFLKWWSSAEVQAQFYRDLEDELSILGRFTPANVEALDKTYWKRSELEVLMYQWESVYELPEIPGGYFITRNLDNAFREVYFSNSRPMEALFYWNKAINREIEGKRAEFGLS